MSKRRRNKDHASRFIAARELARSRLTFNEPVIRVFDRIGRYNERRSRRDNRIRKIAKLAAQSPRRKARVQQNMFLKSVLPKEVYEKVHDCKREWSKLLSWRSAQGSGSRRRSRNERQRNKAAFERRDC